MKIKTPVSRLILLTGMALMIPCYLFTAGNVLFAPWDLYERSRMILIPLTLACTALIILALRAAHRHETFFVRHEKKLLIGFALFYFVVQIVMAHILRYVPRTDAEQCMTAAQLLVDTGTFGNNERSWTYFTRCTNNLGVVYCLSALFRFFGLFGWQDRYMQVILVSTIFFTLGTLCGARVMRRMGGVMAQTRMLILFATCLPFLYCTTELYTDAYALAFPTICIYCCLKAQEGESKVRQAVYLLLFALFTLLGMQMRFTSIVPSIACVIYLLFERRVLRGILAAAAMIIAMLLGQSAVDAETARHLDPADTKARSLPLMHYLVMGLPVQVDEGYGQYGYGKWFLFTTSFEDPEERDAALRQEFIDRVYYLRYPNRLIHMLSRKNFSTFADGTFLLNEVIEADSPEINHPVKEVIFSQGRFYRAYYYVCTALFVAQMLLACAACAQALYRRDTRGAPVFIGLIGAFIILMLWETRARYFFQFEMLLLCACALWRAVPAPASGRAVPAPISEKLG